MEKKLVQKHQKRVEHLHGHRPKLGELKWRLEKSGEEESAVGCMPRDLISWSNQLCQHYLQKCHYVTQNYKNASTRPLVLAHSLR